MTLAGGLSATRTYVKSHLGAIGIGASSALAGAAIGVAATRALRSRSRRKRTRRTTRRVRKKRSPRTRKRRTRHTPRTAGKRRDTSRKRLRYTKNGQPYIILASGKARFVKQKSARTSRKRRGGRY